MDKWHLEKEKKNYFTQSGSQTKLEKSQFLSNNKAQKWELDVYPTLGTSLTKVNHKLMVLVNREFNLTSLWFGEKLHQTIFPMFSPLKTFGPFSVPTYRHTNLLTTESRPIRFIYKMLSNSFVSIYFPFGQTWSDVPINFLFGQTSWEERN